MAYGTLNEKTTEENLRIAHDNLLNFISHAEYLGLNVDDLIQARICVLVEHRKEYASNEAVRNSGEPL